MQFGLVWVPRRGHRASEAFRFEPGGSRDRRVSEIVVPAFEGKPRAARFRGLRV